MWSHNSFAAETLKSTHRSADQHDNRNHCGRIIIKTRVQTGSLSTAVVFSLSPYEFSLSFLDRVTFSLEVKGKWLGNA